MRGQWQHIRVRGAFLLSLLMILSAGALIHAMGSVIATIGDMLATLLGCAAAAFLPIWCSALLLIGISQLPHDNPWFVAAFFFGDF